jgi:two-component system nitrogen regulation response regulator NtrX
MSLSGPCFRGLGGLAAAVGACRRNPGNCRAVAQHLAERGEVPPRRFAVGALNALRMHRWQGDWPELQTAVKNLALTALEEEILTEDVHRILQTELRETSEAPTLLPFFEQPLREARDAFERLYFEHA